MNSRYNRDDLEDLRGSDEPDREISLGTATIIGIFLALALLCAVFFGFGYSLGRHSVPQATNAGEAAGSEGGAASKPSSASPLTTDRSGSSSEQSARPSQAETRGDGDSAADAADSDQQRPAPAPVRTVVVAPPAAHVVAAKASATRQTTAGSTATVAAPGVLVVQVAAVSHQEDANMLAAALKRRGYSVSVHQTAQDKLLHVQVGPFATKKDADAMRQRLQADGYNAIVK